ETRILSGVRNELAARLGRMPTADENAVQVFNIFGDTQQIGKVMTRRVKGTSGAIEIVVGMDPEGTVAGMIVQSLREPANVVEALQSDTWRKRLQHQSADSAWDRHALVADLPRETQPSAEAIIEGVRSAVILTKVSEQPFGAVAQTHHH